MLLYYRFLKYSHFSSFLFITIQIYNLSCDSLALMHLKYFINRNSAIKNQLNTQHSTLKASINFHITFASATMKC